MAAIIVRHKVSDYAKWKAVYDQYKNRIKTIGGRSQTLLRNAENPNELLILSKWDSIDSGRKWVTSDVLKQAMAEAGVADKPTFFLLDEVEEMTY